MEYVRRLSVSCLQMRLESASRPFHVPPLGNRSAPTLLVAALNNERLSLWKWKQSLSFNSEDDLHNVQRFTIIQFFCRLIHPFVKTPLLFCPLVVPRIRERRMSRKKKIIGCVSAGSA